MYVAAQENSKECLDMLLTHGCDANQANVRSHWMSCDDVVLCVVMLFDCDCVCFIGVVTAWMLCCCSSQIGAVTPVYIAAQNNNKECLDMLLRYGADANKARVRSHWMSCDDVVLCVVMLFDCVCGCFIVVVTAWMLC